MLIACLKQLDLDKAAQARDEKDHPWWAMGVVNLTSRKSGLPESCVALTDNWG
jgi:hypothetical protein